MTTPAAHAAPQALAPEAIAKLATLSRLTFSPEQLAKFSSEFNNILAFVAKIQAAPTANVAPLTSVRGLTQPELTQTPERPDAVTHPTPGGPAREALQASAPATQQGFYVVPKIVE